MRRLLLLIFVAMLPMSLKAAGDKEKVINGFDGGMMLHTGYIKGYMKPIDHTAEGAPFGIGGVIRMHLGQHWRVGAEGYVSTLSQLGNGSYSKFGWGGVVGDFYWTFGRFMPYAGLTIGGGANTNLIMMEEETLAWAPLEDAYYHRAGFMAIDPYIGCDLIMSDKFHFTLKFDWLNTIGKDVSSMPRGPRAYIGFLFYH